ncbi:ABC transporter ATP-binding protein [Amphibiibacter pelophylacis]|uniref:ABC transporter ATP-binding protein n=1 Tax=Amphibiibacter pelophylacis TaxID=1799477 RepID=A0ACC6P3K2_9BURK
MAGIELKNITKRWGDVVVIPKLDLTVHDGEFLVLLGSSGCGKTTTMRMIAGLDEPTSGDILFDGQRMNDLPPKDRNVAMVFQNYGLYPHLSVRENIRYPLKVRKVPTAQQNALIQQAARRVEIESYLDRKPKELSGGQRQRVALARAIVRQPRVFLMDEPLSNLDAKLRVTMRSELKHLHGELGTTVVYVTHDQIEAMTLATRVAIMSHGVIQQLDTPRVIYNDPANLFVAGFIGSPAMNFIEGQLEGGAFVAPDVRLEGVPLSCPNPVKMGFRWEDADLVAPGEGQARGTIFAVELIGEATQVTVQLAGQRVALRGHKDFAAAEGSPIGLKIHTHQCFFFDSKTEQRLRPAA